MALNPVEDTIMRMVDLIAQRNQPTPIAPVIPPAGVRPLGARGPVTVPEIRTIQPAPAPVPAPRPVVTALPSPGMGAAPPPMPHGPVVGPAPGTQPAPAPQGNPPLLSGMPTLDFLMGDPKAAETDWNAGGSSDWNPGAPTLDFMGGVKTALDAPGDAVFGLIGEEGYQFALGNRGVYQMQAGTGMDPFLQWVAQNPDLVTSVHDEGYVAPDGTRFTGGQAVWQRYGVDNPAHAAIARTVGDPLNLLGGPAKAIGKGLVGAGIKIAEHPGAVANILGKGIEYGGKGIAGADIAYERVLGAAGGLLGAGAKGGLNLARQTPGLDRVTAQVGRWFELSPWAKAQRNLNNTLAALLQRDSAASRAGQMVPDPHGMTPGIQTSPATIVPEGITDAASGITGGPSQRMIETLQRNAGRRTANGWEISEEFRAGPGVNRELIGPEDAPRFQLDSRRAPVGDGAHRGNRWTVRAIGDDRSVARGRGFDTREEALAFIDSTLGPNGPAAQEAGGVATLTRPTEAAPASLYEEALSPKRSSRVQAGERAKSRLMTLRDALPADSPGRGDIEDIWTSLSQTRDDILSSTERSGPGERDIRNAANRAELWLAEFDAETAARQVLRDAGIPLPPYRNIQPKESLAASLDTLAWNPDEEAAKAARDRITAIEVEAGRTLGANSTVTSNLRMAREAAEENRGRFAEMTAPAPEPATPLDPHLEGLPEGDRRAWRAALRSENGRGVEFQAADSRLRRTHQVVEFAFDHESDDDAYLLAATRYQEAWQEANRLLERVKREDDAIQAAFRGGAVTPAAREAINAGGELAREAMDAADASFRLGDVLAPEAQAVLDQTFGEANAFYSGRSYGEVADEIRQQVTGEKNRLLQLLSRPGSALDRKETVELNKLKKIYPGVETLADAAAIDPHTEFVRRLRQAFEIEAGATDPTRLGRAADTGSRIYSAVNLLMPWAFPRYYLGNLSGDSWQVLLSHGPQALGAMSDPANLAAMTRYAVKGGDPLTGAVGDLVKAAGLGGFHQSLVTENLAEAIWARERAAINRAGGRTRFNLLGGIDKVTGTITNPARNLANGLEWSHRTGLWAHLFRTNVITAKAGFVTEMADLAARHGVSEGALREVMEALPPVVDGAEVADAVGRLALAQGVEKDAAKGFATEMGRRWASTVYRADEAARAGVNQALFSYEQTNVDRWLRRVIPFHMWASRSIPFYAEQALRHPGFAATYYHLYEGTKAQAEAEGWPAPLRTFVKLWEGPGGMMGMFNPLATVGLMDFAFESNGGYTEENVSAVGQLLNRVGEYGFSLLPWWAAALNLTGYMGDSPLGLDPIGTHQARRFLGGLVQLAAGEGWLGQDQQRLLDKPYEQMWQDVRSHLSGFLPGSVEIPVRDPQASPARDIRNIMLRHELEDRGLTLNTYLQLAAQAETAATSEAGLLVAEINDAVAAQELDGGAPYMRAVRDWSRSNAIANMVNAVIPGPKRTRQEEGLAIQSLAGSYFAGQDGEPAVIAGVGAAPDHDPSLQLDSRDREFVRRWQERFGAAYRQGDLKRMQEAALAANSAQNAPPETATILEQQSAYYALGTERERHLMDQYYDIAYARTDWSLPGQRTRKLAKGKGGPMWMSQEDLATLDQDTRWDLAEAWLREVDPGGELGHLRELRDLYEQTHPEFGAYQTWQRDTRQQWGTAAAFRAAAVRANPNYARFISQETNKLRRAGKSASEITAEIDDMALSLDAFLAYNGMRKSRFDPMPLDTGAPLPVASEGAPEGALGGGGFGGGKSWGERVQDAIRDTEDALRASQEYLGVRLDELPEPIQKGYLASADYPEEARPPADDWIYWDYVDFYMQAQQNGTDGSVEAFIASTSNDPTAASPQYQPGVWPPQPAA